MTLIEVENPTTVGGTHSLVGILNYVNKKGEVNSRMNSLLSASGLWMHGTSCLKILLSTPSHYEGIHPGL